jgi:hypothetical protein
MRRKIRVVGKMFGGQILWNMGCAAVSNGPWFKD